MVFILFALALLAGWGLDELSNRSRAFPRRNVAVAVAVVLFCVPVVWMLVAGTLAPGSAQACAEAGLGLRRPPSARPAGGADQRDCRDDPAERPAAVAAAGGRRTAADRRPPARHPAARLGHAGWAVRRARRHGAGGRPVPGQHGLQPRDPDRPRRAADHGRHPLPAGADPEPLRRPGLQAGPPAAAARPGDPLRPLRRARLRLPGREALRRLVAGDGRAARVLQHPDRGGHEHPTGDPRDEPAERHRRRCRTRPIRPASCLA